MLHYPFDDTGQNDAAQPGPLFRPMLARCCMLARVGGEFAQELAGRHGPGGQGGGAPENVGPVGPDHIFPDLAADQRFQGLERGTRIEDVEPSEGVVLQKVRSVGRKVEQGGALALRKSLL